MNKFILVLTLLIGSQAFAAKRFECTFQDATLASMRLVVDVTDEPGVAKVSAYDGDLAYVENHACNVTAKYIGKSLLQEISVTCVEKEPHETSTYSILVNGNQSQLEAVVTSIDESGNQLTQVIMSNMVMTCKQQAAK